LEICMY